MCSNCEREEAARRAAEPRRTLQLSEILRGQPCYAYSSRAEERFAQGSVEVTVSTAVDQATDWDWFWAASRLLTVAGYGKFADRVHGFEEGQGQELAPYQKLMRESYDVAAAAYHNTLARGEGYEAAAEAYDKATEVARAALNAAQDVRQGRVAVASATAFAEIYISEEGTTEETGNDRYYAEGNDDYDEDEYGDNDY